MAVLEVDHLIDPSYKDIVLTQPNLTILDRLRTLSSITIGDAQLEIVDPGQTIDMPDTSRLSLLERTCFQYLALPTHFDNFKNHRQRKQWLEFLRTELGDQYVEALDSNRLRTNWFYGLLIMFELELEDVGQVNQRLSRFKEDITDHLEALPYFDHLHVNYRLSVVSKTATACREYLEI